MLTMIRLLTVTATKATWYLLLFLLVLVLPLLSISTAH